MSRIEVAIKPATTNSVEASFIVGDDRFDVRFRASVPLFAERADALVPLGLVPAMRTGRPLKIPEVVSPQLLTNAAQAQDILASFSDGTLSPIDIVATPAATVPRRSNGVGCFFSCGVDSFFSALEHAGEITHLIFVQGFDVLAAGTPRADAALGGARAAAAELGVELVEVETNLRTMTEVFAQWQLAHGAALGVVALLLQRYLRRVYVPAGQAYRDLFPFGSHPLLDPLWGTESLEIVHDGCELRRDEKVAVISSSKIAMRYLRVCTKQYATYNCGRCEKCLRTLASLRLAGALDRCSTLPDSIDLGQLAKLRPSGARGRANWGRIQEQARRVKDWPLLAAISWATRPRVTIAARQALGRARRALVQRDREPAGVRT